MSSTARPAPPRAAAPPFRSSSLLSSTRGTLLPYAQLGLVAAFLIVAAITASSGGSELHDVLLYTLVLAGFSALALAVPWPRLHPYWLILVPVADVVVIVLLRDTLFLTQPGVGILTLLPVLWLSYSFGMSAMFLAIGSGYFVAVVPFLSANTAAPTASQWANVPLVPAVMSLVAVAIYAVAIQQRRQRAELVEAYEQLRVSIADGVDSEEALRVSVAEGADSAAALLVSVADGLEGAEALRVSLADGIDSEEALRVSLAAGVTSADALRAADARTAVGASALRAADARTAVSDNALRVSDALGVINADALRASDARGAASADALRVSLAHEQDGAEALRVSIADGLDAASAALAVVDTVDAGITFYDPDGTILLTNDTARALAAAAGSISDARILDAIPLIFEADRVTPVPPERQVMARAARGELVSRRLSWVGSGADQKALFTTSRFVRRASGELIGTVIATHDVTPLAEAIQSRDEFLTTVSHELRTPLTIMIGFLDLIEDSVDLEAAGVSDAFEAVQRNGRRLFALITDLLASADEEAPVDRRPFDIAELCRVAIDSARAASDAAGLAVHAVLETSVSAEVNADQISSVLDKVLSNAVAFTRPGGTVTVSAENDVDDAVIRITDTGVGMTEADRAQMFRRFFRSATARLDAVTGAGLGLSTAKIIVDAHHGSITAASELGVGTTIEIRLPHVAAQEH